MADVGGVEGRGGVELEGHHPRSSGELRGAVSLAAAHVEDGPPRAFGGERDAVRALDPGLPIVRARTLEEEAAMGLVLPGIVASVAGTLGSIGMRSVLSGDATGSPGLRKYQAACMSTRAASTAAGSSNASAGPASARVAA